MQPAITQHKHCKLKINSEISESSAMEKIFCLKQYFPNKVKMYFQRLKWIMSHLLFQRRNIIIEYQLRKQKKTLFIPQIKRLMDFQLRHLLVKRLLKYFLSKEISLKLFYVKKKESLKFLRKKLIKNNIQRILSISECS